MKIKSRHPRIKRKNEKERIFPRILLLILLLTGVVVVSYSPARPFLEPLTQKVFSCLQHRTKAKGIQTTDLRFENIRWKFPGRVSWNNVSLCVRSASRGPFLGGVQGVLRVREIELSFLKLILGEGRVVASGGSFTAVSDPDPEKHVEFFADQFQLRFHVLWWPPDLLRLRLGRLFNEAYRLLKEGKTTVPIRLFGRIRFMIFGKQEEGRIWTVKDGMEYRLVMNPDDLKRITGLYPEPVSDIEIDVLARYPLWASKALRITDDAREISSSAFKKDPDVPRDAFRHVWWSYHLTKAFGPEFSMELSNAHELGSTTNTEADHIMDYKNNQIGSDYALRGYPEGSLLERMVRDPDVYAFVSEVYRRLGIPMASKPSSES